MKVGAAIRHGLNSAGRLRHFAPFRQRQMIASMVRFRS
jgi:hypothetical protein